MDWKFRAFVRTEIETLVEKRALQNNSQGQGELKVPIVKRVIEVSAGI